MTDEYQICFIICANDDQRLQECLLYLGLLHIPNGYSVDVITVEDTVSMAAGYNEAMRASDAKYKIYLQQDVFIVERFFLDYLLRVFQREKEIGLIGIAGDRNFTGDKTIWHDKEDEEFTDWVAEIMRDVESETEECGYKEVEVIDGMLLATQYDIPWREDLFHGFDFYDISQCMEFRRAGYKIAVLTQENEWMVHTGGIHGCWNYRANREIFLQSYPEIASLKADRKRILFLHSKDIQLYGIPYALIQLGHYVFVAHGDVTLGSASDIDKAEQEMVEELLEEGNYDLAVTYDFCPSVSNACQVFQIPYYAWVYDDPELGLYRKEVLNEINYISVFDRKQYERLSGLGIKNLFYLPLAAAVDILGLADIKEDDVEKYSCEVSFVGSLYNNRGFEQTFDENGVDYIKEAEALIGQMGCRWDENTTIFGKASEELIRYMVGKEPENTWQAWNIDRRYFCESMVLARKCNEVERVGVLGTLQRKFQTVLYADESAKRILPEIVVRPKVDYGSEMPKVFYLSKINLNISSRSIESGIPQRVWDILAVGGFCLTNYQPELEEYFEIGRDLEVYHDLEELERKTAYYLAHEDERLMIAINGYKKVRKEHDIKQRLRKVLDIIF